MAARKIFRSVDGDGNGKLDRQELGMLVQELRASMGAHLLNGPAVSILYVSCLCFSALLAVSFSLLFLVVCLILTVLCLY